MINGWGIDERTRYGTIIRQRIIEFDDRNVVDYVWDRLNVWAKDKLYDLETNEEVDVFCDCFYQTGYNKAIRESKFYMWRKEGFGPLFFSPFLYFF